MERYLYLSHAGYDYEGDGVTGIHTSLEEAKKFTIELCKKTSNDGNFFFIVLWDTQKQGYIYRWDLDKDALTWESWGQSMICALKQA